MEGTAARQAPAKAGNQTASTTTSPVTSRAKSAADTNAAGYGMPCANCRAYYPADMHTCPICHAQQRVSPISGVQAVATQGAAAQVPAPPDQAQLLAEEREKLRELKSQIYASHSQVGPSTFRCALDQNHDREVEPAAVCHSCYSTARQQGDRMEAALHMDVKEAAKIVYEAVWADPSDPNKTYLNAAHALLSELRHRAGIGLVLGSSHQPRPH